MRDKLLNILLGVLIVTIIGVSIYALFFNNEEEKEEDGYIKLNKIIVNLYINETEKLGVLINNVSLDGLEWKSDNDSVASVSNEGVIYANGVGNATITVSTKDGKLSDSCTVEVTKKKIEKLILDKSNIEIKVGETTKLNVKIVPNDIKDEKIKWASGNETIVKVDDDGLVTAIKKGEAVVKAINEDIISECLVRVIEPEPVVVETEKPKETQKETPKETTPTPPTPTVSKVEMHFINAGGYYDDAILIRSDKATIFIDGGRGKDAVVKYLKELKVSKIDYVIGSHTEYDHIDAQGEVIRQFDVKHALYPNNITKCGCSCESSDVWNVNSALKSKNMTPEVQSVPSKLVIEDMTLYFIAPLSIGCNKNNNSFIFILQFGNKKFMFTGDADSVFNRPDDLIANAKSLGLSGIEADVFKHPHHGNETLSDKLFDTMKTKYIIVPNVNASQHPSQLFRDKANAKGIKMYRQSDSKTGNILITSDGNNINFTMDVVASTYAK